MFPLTHTQFITLEAIAFSIVFGSNHGLLLDAMRRGVSRRIREYAEKRGYMITLIDILEVIQSVLSQNSDEDLTIEDYENTEQGGDRTDSRSNSEVTEENALSKKESKNQKGGN